MRLDAGNRLAVAAVEYAKQGIAMGGNALAGAVPVLIPGRIGKAAAQALYLGAELLTGFQQLLQHQPSLWLWQLQLLPFQLKVFSLILLPA